MTAYPDSITIDRGESIKLKDAAGRTLRSLEGTLWITPGDGSDIIVEAGGCYRVAKAGDAFVTALGGSAKLKIAGVQSTRWRWSNLFLSLIGAPPATKVNLPARQ